MSGARNAVCAWPPRGAEVKKGSTVVHCPSDRRLGRDEVRDLSASLIPLSAIGDQDADSNAS
jgi:hypothetical protein